jgi:molybdate-binding protein
VHAAAANFALEFVPLVRERYWLAMRERTLASPAAQKLLRALSGKPLARLLRGRPGYDLAGAGEIHDVDEAIR